MKTIKSFILAAVLVVLCAAGCATDNMATSANTPTGMPKGVRSRSNWGDALQGIGTTMPNTYNQIQMNQMMYH